MLLLSNGYHLLCTEQLETSLPILRRHCQSAHQRMSHISNELAHRLTTAKDNKRLKVDLHTMRTLECRVASTLVEVLRVASHAFTIHNMNSSRAVDVAA